MKDTCMCVTNATKITNATKMLFVSHTKLNDHIFCVYIIIIILLVIMYVHMEANGHHYCFNCSQKNNISAEYHHCTMQKIIIIGAFAG